MLTYVDLLWWPFQNIYTNIESLCDITQTNKVLFINYISMKNNEIRNFKAGKVVHWFIEGGQLAQSQIGQQRQLESWYWRPCISGIHRGGPFPTTVFRHKARVLGVWIVDAFLKGFKFLCCPTHGFASVAFCLFTLHLKHCCVFSSSKCEKPSLKVTRKKKKLEMGSPYWSEMVTSTADIIERLIKKFIYCNTSQTWYHTHTHFCHLPVAGKIMSWSPLYSVRLDPDLSMNSCRKSCAVFLIKETS